MSADWLAESFKDNFAQVFEAESLADAELGNSVRDQNLFRLRVRTKAGGQLHRRSKKVVMLLDRFTGCGADSHPELSLRVRLRVLGQFALNLNCTPNCCGRRDE